MGTTPRVVGGVLGMVAILAVMAWPSRLRPLRAGGVWTGGPDAGSVPLGWLYLDPVLEAEMNPPPRVAFDKLDVAQHVAINSLPRRLEAHYAELRRLREENRQLCEQVVRLLGERPRSRPCS